MYFYARTSESMRLYAEDKNVHPGDEGMDGSRATAIVDGI